MARFFYSALQYILFPLVVLRMLWRSRRAPAYRRRIGERLGYVTAPTQHPCLWVHAVSVGETLAAAPLIERLLTDYPDYRIVVTTTTPTGSERVMALFGDSVHHCYAPYDLPGAVCRFLARVEPRAVIIMETELWPNMLHYTAHRNIPVLLANARLSERAAMGYNRVSGLTRQMLRQLHQVAAQTDDDGRRFVQLGLDPAALTVTGSIKWDVDISPELKTAADSLASEWRSQERPVLVAASTHPGEEAMLLQVGAVLRQRFPELLLVLVPRHPERFEAVLRLARDSGCDVARRSEPDNLSPATEVLVGDTMGELTAFLGAARIAFVGGSLIPHGGHNLLEAAAWGIPVLTGPHTFNFERVTQLLASAGGVQVVADTEELSVCIIQLLEDHDRATAMGNTAREVVRANRGALGRLLGLIPGLLRLE